MELAFAHARSKDKVCGICMEVVMVRNTIFHRIFHTIISPIDMIQFLLIFIVMLSCRISPKERLVSELCLTAIIVTAFPALENGDKPNSLNIRLYGKLLDIIH